MNVKHLLLVLVCALTASVAVAENIYKTIDANGRVSYTNKKPADAAVRQQEMVEIRESTSNQTNPAQVGTDWYCGSIQLPNSDELRTDTAFYEQVASKKKEWLSKVKTHEKSLLNSQKRTAFRYHSGSSSYETPENLAAAQDWRCAIAWAGEQEAALGKQQSEIEQKILLEEAKLTELNAALDRTCGVRPEYSLDRIEKPSATLERQSNWDSCASPHQSLVRQVKKNLEEQNTQLSLLHKIKLRFQFLDS